MTTQKRNPRRTSQALPLFLIGGGLLVLGIAAMLKLPSSGGAIRFGGSPRVVPAQVNFAAPDLQLTDLQGNPVALSDYLGQVVLVNNWATWCPPCKEEMPTLEAYYRAHQDSGFTIIAIEAGEPVADVVRFVEEYRLTFPVWPDPTQMALAAFRQDAMPSSYLVDRQGVVRLAWTGAIDRKSLEKYVTPLLEE